MFKKRIVFIVFFILFIFGVILYSKFALHNKANIVKGVEKRMGERNIVKNDFAFLHKKSKIVEDFNENLNVLLDDMAETLHSKKGAVGLAAVQVGILKRVVVIDVGEGLIELVNPEIIEEKGEQIGMEGCLSFPEQFKNVKRPFYVKVKAYDRKGKEFYIEGEELLARVLCHEIDHLNGIVFLDKAQD